MTSRKIELNHTTSDSDRVFGESRGKGLEMVHTSPVEPPEQISAPDDGSGNLGQGDDGASVSAPDYDD